MPRTGGHNLHLGLGGYDKTRHIPTKPKAKEEEEEGETWRLALEDVSKNMWKQRQMRAKTC